MSRAGGRYRGTYVLERVPRGRYVVEQARATVDDPFGLARMDVDLDARGSLLVYPRLVHARPALLRERRPRPGRPAAAAAPPVRLRSPLRARVRAGGVAPEGALEDDGAPRAADGEGARGRATRRDRGHSRRGRERSGRGQLRRAGARRRLDPACARVPRPAGGAHRQLGDSADGPRHLARRRLAGGAGDPRRGGAGRQAAGRGAALARGRACLAGGGDGRDHGAALRRARVQARPAGALGPGSQRRLDRHGELRGAADEGRARAAPASGGGRRRRRHPPRRLAGRRARARRPRLRSAHG